MSGGFEKMLGPFRGRWRPPEQADAWEHLLRTLYDGGEPVEVLVNVAPYTGTASRAHGVALAWCALTGIAPGSAAVYPCKVRVPDRGEGQYAWREIRGARYPHQPDPPETHPVTDHPRDDMRTRGEND